MCVCVIIVEKMEEDVIKRTVGRYLSRYALKRERNAMMRVIRYTCSVEMVKVMLGCLDKKITIDLFF